MIKGLVDPKPDLRCAAAVIDRHALVTDGNLGLDSDALIPTIRLDRTVINTRWNFSEFTQGRVFRGFKNGTCNLVDIA